MLYSQNKLFTKASEFLFVLFFKDVFSVFPEIGLGIKKFSSIVYLLTDFIKLQKIHWRAMSQVKVPICKVVVVYYSQVKNMHLIASTHKKPSVWISIISNNLMLWYHWKVLNWSISLLGWFFCYSRIAPSGLS